MRKILLFLILFIFPAVVNAEMILQGSAEYNVESARDVVQDNIQYKIDPRLFTPFLIDNNRQENAKMILNGKLELKDRTLATFSVGTYGIVYKNDLLHAYYYSYDGVLEYVDVRSDTKYPYKSYQYDIKGNLVNMGLRISKEETYIYDPQGNLMAHWVGPNGYDEKGNIVMTRQYSE